MEELAVLFTLCSVFTASNNQKINWIFGIIAAFFYGVIFYQQNLYANFILQIFYIIIGFLGYFIWNEKDTDFHIDLRSMNYYYNRWIIIFSFLYFLVILFGGELKILDCLLTSGSIIATWMLIKKDIRSWLLWFYIDIFYILLFLSDLLIFSAFLYTILAIFSLFTYVKLKRK
jgi:nicotinamide mononucleotide transporter